MAKPNFDTHLAYADLIRAGFDEKQADKIIDVIKDSQTDLATKDDIATLSLKLNGLYALYALQMAWLSWLSLKLVDMSATLAVVAELVKK